jgi:hypothetical protein
VNLKRNDPPGEIVPLPNELPVTVCGAEVVLFQITVVPGVIFRACGLNVKTPLLSVVMVTTTVGTCVGVGVGFCGVGVGDGFGGIGVGLGLDIVGVEVGLGEFDVGPVGLGVGDKTNGVFVRPTFCVLVTVGSVLAVVVLLSPPQATRTINNAVIKRLYQATRLETYMFFSIQNTCSRLF